MAGRHGKLSSSPFHVVSIRNIAGEQYGDSCRRTRIQCKYKSREQICQLHQSKSNYNRMCAHYNCNFIKEELKEARKRSSCAFAFNNKCLCKTELCNCSEKNDLAYCCDYYIPKDRGLNIRALLSHVYNYDALVGKLKMENQRLSDKKTHLETLLCKSKTKNIEYKIIQNRTQLKYLQNDIAEIEKRIERLKKAKAAAAAINQQSSRWRPL